MFATRDDDTIVRLHEVGVELPRPTTLRTLGRRAEMLPALRDLSLAVRCGQTLGIVGEHGSGKSTLAEVLLGWWRPTSGTVTFDGRDGSVELSSLQGASLRAARAPLRLVGAKSRSLEPWMTVEKALTHRAWPVAAPMPSPPSSSACCSTWVSRRPTSCRPASAT